MANKFSLSKNKTDHAAGKVDTSLHAPLPKPDWDEKTISSWTEHSSFLENSRVIKMSPPPRMIARPPAPQPTVVSPLDRRWLRYVVMVVVLGVCACGGLYANGFLDPLLSGSSGTADSASSAPATKPHAIQKRNGPRPSPESSTAPPDPAAEPPAPANSNLSQPGH